MQICTSFQTDNHASTPPLSFLQAGCPSCRPTNSVKALKDSTAFSIIISLVPHWYYTCDGMGMCCKKDDDWVMKCMDFSSQAFSVSAPSTWNSLPAHIRSIDILSTFKRHLKFHLFHFSFTVQSSGASASALFSRFWRYINSHVHLCICIWSMKYRVTDQEEDQTGPGERLWKRTAKHVNWSKRTQWMIVNGESW